MKCEARYQLTHKLGQCWSSNVLQYSTSISQMYIDLVDNLFHFCEQLTPTQALNRFRSDLQGGGNAPAEDQVDAGGQEAHHHQEEEEGGKER